MNIAQFNFNEMVTLNGNQVMTTSLKVAEYFGKQHKDVLRKIRHTISDCDNTEYTQRNFAPFDFIDKNGEAKPAFNLTRNGFMLLVMSFTGKLALQIKIKYMQAFDWMTEQLSSRYMSIERLQHEFVVKDRLSKAKASIGSRFMNERKREKRLLNSEYQKLLSSSQLQIEAALL